MARCRMAKPIPGGATTKRTLRPRRDPAATQRRRGRSMAMGLRSGLVWEQAWTGDGHAWGRARVGMGAWRRHAWRWERGGGTRGSGSGWEWVRVAQLGGCVARWVRPVWGSLPQWDAAVGSELSGCRGCVSFGGPHALGRRWWHSVEPVGRVAVGNAVWGVQMCFGVLLSWMPLGAPGALGTVGGHVAVGRYASGCVGD